MYSQELRLLQTPRHHQRRRQGRWVECRSTKARWCQVYSCLPGIQPCRTRYPHPTCHIDRSQVDRADRPTAYSAHSLASRAPSSSRRVRAAAGRRSMAFAVRSALIYTPYPYVTDPLELELELEPNTKRTAGLICRYATTGQGTGTGTWI
jgi:hypothetical protein